MKGLAAYSASRAGVQALVASLAQDMASKGVTVNAVAPVGLIHRWRPSGLLIR